MERATLERMLAEGLSLDEIGRRVGRHASTVGYWVAKHGLSAAHADRHRARGPIDRATLEALVARHLTIREIAGELGRAPATVRHWLAKHGLRTTPTARRRDKAATAPGGRFTTTCTRHGRTSFVVRQDGTSACLRCRTDAVVERRRRVKQRLVEEAGGGCVICGYSRCVAALHFHHVDPATKRLEVGGRGLTHAWQTLRAEADKCVLLCANCHAEVEAGVMVLR